MNPVNVAKFAERLRRGDSARRSSKRKFGMSLFGSENFAANAASMETGRLAPVIILYAPESDPFEVLFKFADA